MANSFLMPERVYTGEGALEAAGAELSALGKKALLVTDPVMVKLGAAERVRRIIVSGGAGCDIFSGVTGEPTDLMVEAGLAAYRGGGCDFLAAVGGGSALDTMKAIGLLAACGGKAADYMGKEASGPLPPFAAIPTTAGTGSEATQFTIITDTNNGVKMLLRGRSLIPRLAVADPEFTRTAPPKVTAATGLDALTHAVEAYTSRKAQPLSDTFALSAVKRIFCFLPAAYRCGENTEARAQMSIAALEAGIAFNNSSVTLVHGMSRPIGALYHVPHGLSNAMLLKECLSFALSGAEERFAQLGETIGAASAGDARGNAAKSFLSAAEQLCGELGIPTPAEYGIGAEEFRRSIPKMAADAMASGSPQNTRRPVSQKDLEEIYARLFS